MSMWQRSFWKATAERAVSTVAQAGGAFLVAAGTGLVDTDWLGVASVAGMAGVLAVLKSLAANAVTGDGPGLTGAEMVVPEADAF